ncbi:hypothetical protein HDU93_003712, partial [Gonapodya sp. JEL0774]
MDWIPDNAGQHDEEALEEEEPTMALEGEWRSMDVEEEEPRSVGGEGEWWSVHVGEEPSSMAGEGERRSVAAEGEGGTVTVDGGLEPEEPEPSVADVAVGRTAQKSLSKKDKRGLQQNALAAIRQRLDQRTLNNKAGAFESALKSRLAPPSSGTGTGKGPKPKVTMQ